MLIYAISVGVVIWLLKGYLNYEAYYNQSLILEYLERNGLPCPTHDDFEVSKKELSKRHWVDIKFCVLQDRFPFNRIPGKYLWF